jgi:signal transduction histidine kinase
MKKKPKLDSQGQKVPPPPQEELKISNSIPVEIKANHPSIYEISHLEGELRLTLEEIARLQNALADSNMKIIALQSSPPATVTSFKKEDYLLTILPELEQPIHTIQGYLDLLLNESVGILGTFQKRFLERIAKSVQRMDDLLVDLESRSNPLKRDISFFANEFSVKTVIEETFSLFADQIRKEIITYREDLPEEDIMVYGDLDTFEKIMNYLFTNACNSAKNEGTISIRAREVKSLDLQELYLIVRTNCTDCENQKGQSLNLGQYKDQELILQQFGSPLKDLAKLQRLVEEMNGRMVILTFQKAGSMITVTIPISRQTTQK